MPLPTSNFFGSAGSIAQATLLTRCIQAVYDTTQTSFNDFVGQWNAYNKFFAPSTGGLQTAWGSFEIGNTIVVCIAGLTNLRQVLAAMFLSGQENLANNAALFGTGSAGRISTLARQSFQTSMVTNIRNQLGTTTITSPNVLIAGHSYGGVHAQQLALNLKANPTINGKTFTLFNCWSFGSPKIFDAAGVAYFTSQVNTPTISSFNVNCEGDPVSYHPSPNLFTAAQAMTAAGSLSRAYLQGAEYTATPDTYFVSNTGYGEAPPFEGVRVLHQIEVLRHILETGEISPEHRIETYYGAYDRLWQAQNRSRAATSPSRQAQQAIRSIPMPNQPAGADIPATSMPAASTYQDRPAPPAGGSTNGGQQIVVARGLPRRADSVVVGPRTRWARGDGRVHKQMKKTLRLMGDMLAHDDRVRWGIRPGTQVLTNDAVWTPEAEQAYWDTMILLETILEQRG
jgi:pimeloyl-ACP methyl ester carboxylesterase